MRRPKLKVWVNDWRPGLQSARRCKPHTQKIIPGEIHAISSQVIALEASVSSVLARIAQADPRLSSAIADGFTDALKVLERLAKAMRLVGPPRPSRLSSSYGPQL